MTPTQEAAHYIGIELANNGIQPTDEVYDEISASLKEGLVELECKVFRQMLNKNGMGAPDPKAYSVEDIIVYPGGASGIKLCAPGGAIEVGEDGMPLPHEIEAARKRLPTP